MASVRITYNLKGDILENAMKGAYQAELDALDAREKALGDSMYRLLVTEAQEALMKKLPGNFFFSNNSFRVTPYTDANKSASSMRATLSGDRRMPKHLESYGNDLQVTPEIMAEIAAIDVEGKRIKKLVDGLSKKIMGILSSVTTTGKLLEVWPEAAKFLPDYATNPTTPNLPAVLVGEVNAMLVAAKHERLAAA